MQGSTSTAPCAQGTNEGGGVGGGGGDLTKHGIAMESMRGAKVERPHLGSRDTRSTPSRSPEIQLYPNCTRRNLNQTVLKLCPNSTQLASFLCTYLVGAMLPHVLGHRRCRAPINARGGVQQPPTPCCKPHPPQLNLAYCSLPPCWGGWWLASRIAHHLTLHPFDALAYW